MGEKIYKTVSTSSSDEVLKNITNVLKKVSIDDTDDTTLPGLEDLGTVSYNSSSTDGLGGTTGSEVSDSGNEGSYGNSKFKVCTTTALTKPTLWTKIKRVLFTEITVGLTPHQQKIENEINDYLHQEITWKSLKEAALSEVPITWRGKRIL